MSDIQDRIKRDTQNALDAKSRADSTLKKPPPQYVFSSFVAEQRSKEQFSLRSIANNPFHAMVEVEMQTKDGQLKSHLLYSNVDITTNIILPCNGGNSISVHLWTHPAIQIGLVQDLKELHDVSTSRYNIVAVKPIARARFNQVIPFIIGIYDPGGSVGSMLPKRREGGLKAVKLDMTQDQVNAFLSRMNGVIFVTGAPGSGKTTVAFQRIRFLLDQQDMREQTGDIVTYSVDTTRIFLSNNNLVAYSKQLLERHLNIPSHVVELIQDFIPTYVAYAWAYKGGARPSQKKIASEGDTRAREAFFSLCRSDDLKGCWGAFRKQIAQRLLKAQQTQWFRMRKDYDDKIQARISVLAQTIVRYAKSQIIHMKETGDPLRSGFRMDNLYARCGKAYEDVRSVLEIKKEREAFDESFAKWLYFVFDPIECIKAYFKNKKHEGGLRIRHGTASRADEKAVIEEIFADWADRMYRSEETAWIAWLLRFSLPEEVDAQKRFRKVPCAILTGWANHIVIDEAQDLSVAEASLLSSFVHPMGALTISADFNQVVSPVHGMEDASAFKYGCPINDRSTDLSFPFSKNMRQTKQITEFLRAFYLNVFKQPPPFVPNDDFEDILPQLYICGMRDAAKRIKNIHSILERAKKKYTLALIQINEDEDELKRIRAYLKGEGVPLAPLRESFDKEGRLITSSVERIKGLEYDICFVFGIDDVERSSLKHTINRSYVAISRPARRLVLFCQTFPKLLRGIDESLYKIV